MRQYINIRRHLVILGIIGTCLFTVPNNTASASVYDILFLPPGMDAVSASQVIEGRINQACKAGASQRQIVRLRETIEGTALKGALRFEWLGEMSAKGAPHQANMFTWIRRDELGEVWATFKADHPNWGHATTPDYNIQNLHPALRGIAIVDYLAAQDGVLVPGGEACHFLQRLGADIRKAADALLELYDLNIGLGGGGVDLPYAENSLADEVGIGDAFGDAMRLALSNYLNMIAYERLEPIIEQIKNNDEILASPLEDVSAVGLLFMYSTERILSYLGGSSSQNLTIEQAANGNGAFADMIGEGASMAMEGGWKFHMERSFLDLKTDQEKLAWFEKYLAGVKQTSEGLEKISVEAFSAMRAD